MSSTSSKDRICSIIWIKSGFTANTQDFLFQNEICQGLKPETYPSTVYKQEVKKVNASLLVIHGTKLRGLYYRRLIGSCRFRVWRSGFWSSKIIHIFGILLWLWPDYHSQGYRSLFWLLLRHWPHRRWCGDPGRRWCQSMQAVGWHQRRGRGHRRCSYRVEEGRPSVAEDLHPHLDSSLGEGWILNHLHQH